ncbi:unnamed protein product [Fusarium graminearum]|nr:unnamed protein product [Fusarium graminearum]
MKESGLALGITALLLRNSTTSSDSHIIHNSPRCRAHHSICDCADQEDVLQSWILLFTDTLLHSGSFVCIMRSGSTIEHRRCVMTIEYSSTLSSNVSKLYHRMIQKHIIPVGNLGHHGSIITGQIDDSSFVQDLLRRAGRPAFYDIMSNGPNVLKMSLHVPAEKRILHLIREADRAVSPPQASYYSPSTSFLSTPKPKDGPKESIDCFTLDVKVSGLEYLQASSI